MKKKIEDRNFFEKIYSYIAGDRSKTIYITSEGERIISVPWAFGVLFLLIFDIPSWVISVLLLLLVIFDLEMNVSATYRSDKLKRNTVKASDYKKEKKETKSKITKDKDGFCEILIR